MASKRNWKIWKATPEAVSGFMITPESAVMAGSRSNFIAVDKTGTAISGPVSFVSVSESKRNGGLFVEMPDFVKMIPATIVTLIPQQQPEPPVGLMVTVAKSMPFLLAMAGQTVGDFVA